MNKSLLFLLIAAAGLFFLQSCRKSTLIGTELLPDEDMLNSIRVDTFNIITYTELDDSVVTSQNIFHALGSLNNDTYGKCTAGIYAQVLLPTNNLNFGISPVIDSIILTLDYAGFYGDTSSIQNVSVYRILQKMESGRLYYSDSRFYVLPVPIGKKTNFIPDLRDSVVLQTGGKLEPHLRIKLFDSFGQDILDQDSTVLENDTTFLEYLRGIYIAPDTFTSGYSNGIMYFDLASSLSSVNVFYHNNDADSLQVYLPLTGVKVNSFTHNYTETSAVYPYITNPDTTNGDDKTFVQGFAGLRTIVKIPTLENLKDVSINKAEITFTVSGGDNSNFYPPPKLNFVQLDSTGHNFYYAALYSQEIYYSIIDQDFGFTDNGGIITRGTNKYGQNVLNYSYNVTRHFQEIIEGSIDNNDFALVCFPGNRIPNGVTLAGTDALHFSLKPYLTITYTTINK